MRSSMLHGSETWPVRKENELALQRAEMRMIRWMCNVKVKNRVPSKELRQRLGKRHRLGWRAPDQEERGCVKRLLSTQLNREDAMDRSRWKKLIKTG